MTTPTLGMIEPLSTIVLRSNGEPGLSLVRALTYATETDTVTSRDPFITERVDDTDEAIAPVRRDLGRNVTNEHVREAYRVAALVETILRYGDAESLPRLEKARKLLESALPTNLVRVRILEAVQWVIDHPVGSMPGFTTQAKRAETLRGTLARLAPRFGTVRISEIVELLDEADDAVLHKRRGRGAIGATAIAGKLETLCNAFGKPVRAAKKRTKTSKAGKVDKNTARAVSRRYGAASSRKK